MFVMDLSEEYFLSKQTTRKGYKFIKLPSAMAVCSLIEEFISKCMLEMT